MNHYEKLRVYPSASKKIIKDAYRSLAKKYHPDLFDSEHQKQWGEEKMKDINEAYDVLMDDNKRMLYDKDQGITNGVKPTTNEVKPTTFYIEKERVISFSIALVYILFTLIFGGSSVIYTVIYLLFPMAAIWFSDEMGAYTGPFGRYYIDTESPGCLVKVIGWILLLAFPLFFLYSKIKNL